MAVGGSKKKCGNHFLWQDHLLIHQKHNRITLWKQFPEIAHHSFSRLLYRVFLCVQEVVFSIKRLMFL